MHSWGSRGQNPKMTQIPFIHIYIYKGDPKGSPHTRLLVGLRLPEDPLFRPETKKFNHFFCRQSFKLQKMCNYATIFPLAQPSLTFDPLLVSVQKLDFRRRFSAICLPSDIRNRQNSQVKLVEPKNCSQSGIIKKVVRLTTKKAWGRFGRQRLKGKFRGCFLLKCPRYIL